MQQPSYAEPEKVRAQVQTLSGDDLTVMNDTERTERDRKFYLYAETKTGNAPSGIIRHEAADAYKAHDRLSTF